MSGGGTTGSGSSSGGSSSGSSSSGSDRFSASRSGGTDRFSISRTLGSLLADMPPLEEDLARYAAWLQRLGIEPPETAGALAGQDFPGGNPMWRGGWPRKHDLRPIVDQVLEVGDSTAGIGADHMTALAMRALASDGEKVAGEPALDVGCGSGIVAATAARLGAKPVVATDVDARCMPLVHETARVNNVVIDARRGNLVAPLRPNEQFKTIVANLPQKPCPTPGALDLGHDGGPNGLGILRPFVRDVRQHLAPNGRLYLAHHTLCDPSLIDLLRKAGFSVRVRAAMRRLVCRGDLPPAVAEHIETRRRDGRALLDAVPSHGHVHYFLCLVLLAIRTGPGETTRLGGLPSAPPLPTQPGPAGGSLPPGQPPQPRGDSTRLRIPPGPPPAPR